mmetsp:Transcript_13677/g.41259  ORF Transcript_13677/g.41259 Transcript_13677/m.41259 type:complete len:315 (-) Transcript_13677:73-1017(-)
MHALLEPKVVFAQVRVLLQHPLPVSRIHLTNLLHGRVRFRRNARHSSVDQQLAGQIRPRTGVAVQLGCLESPPAAPKVGRHCQDRLVEYVHGAKGNPADRRRASCVCWRLEMRVERQDLGRSRQVLEAVPVETIIGRKLTLLDGAEKVTAPHSSGRVHQHGHLQQCIRLAVAPSRGRARRRSDLHLVAFACARHLKGVRRAVELCPDRAYFLRLLMLLLPFSFSFSLLLLLWFWFVLCSIFLILLIFLVCVVSLGPGKRSQMKVRIRIGRRGLRAVANRKQRHTIDQLRGLAIDGLQLFHRLATNRRRLMHVRL